MGENFVGQDFSSLYKSIIRKNIELVQHDLRATLRDDLDKCAVDIDSRYNNLVTRFKEQMISDNKPPHLDIHKLASCVCGAIIGAKIFIPYGGHGVGDKYERYFRLPNELLALLCSFEMIQMKLVNDYYEDEDKCNFIIHNIYIPNEITDKHSYLANFMNVLSGSFNLGTYAIIFYHLELEYKYAMQLHIEEVKKSGGFLSGFVGK